MRFSVLLVPLVAVALGACSGAAATAAPSAASAASPSAAASAAPPSAAASAAAPSDTTAPIASPSASSDSAATPTLSGPFAAAGITHYVDPAATAVNPADFETKVPSSAGAVYVVFALKPGTVGKVTLTMTKAGQPAAAPLSLDYTASDTWGDFQLNFPSGDRTGDYVATITFVSSGDSVILPFTDG